MANQSELADAVTEWLGFADRLGPAQKRVILGLSAEWGPSPDHQATKRMWYGVTGRGIKRQRGPVYVVEHKHRTDNCWRLNDNGLRLQVALWHSGRAAQGIEAATAAETVEQGSVHESPVGNADAPKGVGHAQ